MLGLNLGAHARPVMLKRATWAKVFLTIGGLTLAAAVAFDLYFLQGIFRFVRMGAETLWANVFLVLLVVLLIGAAPLAIGFALLRKRRTPDGSVRNA